MKSKIGTTDYKNKNLLIRFYRFATCPICNLHLRNLVQRFDDLRTESLSVLAVFHSPKWRMEKNMPYDLPFEILSDPEKKIFRIYRVGSSLAVCFHGM
jgi:peroxiredoxin